MGSLDLNINFAINNIMKLFIINYDNDCGKNMNYGGILYECGSVGLFRVKDGKTNCKSYDKINDVLNMCNKIKSFKFCDAVEFGKIFIYLDKDEDYKNMFV